jgi:hypothetical protein
MPLLCVRPACLSTMASTKRDMVFSVLFVGDERLILHLVMDSARRLGANDWAEGIKEASLVRLRVMFFLLVDRDMALKAKIVDGWSDLCVAAMDASKAASFFRSLRAEVIDPWLVDERKCEDDFVSHVIDLYLVS